MKRRKSGGMIYLNFGYNMDFANKLKRECGAKWKPDTKEWYFKEEFEEQSNDLMLETYGYSFRPDEMLTLEMAASDFVVNRGKMTAVGLKEVNLVWRESRDKWVSIADNVRIIKGSFPATGGSAKYPSVYIDDENGIVLWVRVHRAFYESLSEEDKSKVKIIETTSKSQMLLAEKERLLVELEKIEKEIENSK